MLLLLSSSLSAWFVTRKLRSIAFASLLQLIDLTDIHINSSNNDNRNNNSNNMDNNKTNRRSKLEKTLNLHLPRLCFTHCSMFNNLLKQMLEKKVKMSFSNCHRLQFISSYCGKGISSQPCLAFHRWRKCVSWIWT